MTGDFIMFAYLNAGMFWVQLCSARTSASIGNRIRHGILHALFVLSMIFHAVIVFRFHDALPWHVQTAYTESITGLTILLLAFWGIRLRFRIIRKRTLVIVNESRQKLARSLLIVSASGVVVLSVRALVYVVA